MAGIALALVLVALCGGAAAGALEALKVHALGPWKSFLIYIGVLGVAATTWAESMDILPLALIFAAATGLLPFVLAYLGLRKLMAKRQAR